MQLSREIDCQRPSSVSSTPTMSPVPAAASLNHAAMLDLRR